MANLTPTKWQAPTGQSISKETPNSSFIQEAEYNAQTFTMTLTFKDGAQHQYFMFYPVEWQQFLESQSKGTFYSKNIRGKKMSAKIQNKNVGRKEK